MKKIIVFTNSENLKNEFEIPYIEEDSNLKCLVEKNLSKMNEDRLFLMKVGLESFSFREDIFITLIEENKNDLSNSEIIGGAVIGYNETGWSFVERFKFAMKSLSIAPEFQGKGMSKLLIKAIFDFFKEKNIPVLKQSSYTEEGYEKIRKNFSKIAANYPTIDFVDPEKD